MLIVFELEFSTAFADEFLAPADPGCRELDQDFVLAFLDDGGFAHTELVDAVADVSSAVPSRWIRSVQLHRLELEDVARRATRATTEDITRSVRLGTMSSKAVTSVLPLT